MSSSDIDKMQDLKDKADLLVAKVQNFSNILDGLKKTEDKKKMLWKEIYENAINDRENASLLFTNGFVTMQQTQDSHVLMGATMSKYLERMSKSNEQIMQLAELISKVEEKESQVDSEEIFAEIKKSQSKKSN